MKALRSLLITSLLAVGLAAPQARAADESPFKFEFHGFVTGSMYMQDQTMLSGQGQGLFLGAPAPANHLPRPNIATDKGGTFLGSDVRQSRFIFAMSGPKVMGGATPKAYFEGDFFGASAAGALGYESAIPRMRQGYVELNWGNTQFQVGQYSAQLLLAQIPASIAHIANPPTFGAGTLGWRPIGFRAIHAIPMDGWKLELAGEIAQGKYADATAAGAAYPGNAPTQVSLAWASGTPQIDVRVKGEGKSGGFGWMGYGAVYYESVNLKGFGNTVAPNGVTLSDGSTKTSISPFVAEVGGKFNFAPVTLAFNFYTGNGTGQLAGSMLQFGDIKDMGYWVQLGADLTKEFSLSVLYGASSADKKDVWNWVNPTNAAFTENNATMKGDNQLIGAMAKYQEGGYALSLEYYQYTTKYLTGTTRDAIGTKSESAYSVLLTGGYFF